MTGQNSNPSSASSASLQRRIRQLEEQVAALTSIRHHFDAVFNHPHSFVGILDREGAVLRENQAALDFIQAEQADIRGKPFWETPWWTHSPSLQDKLRRHVQQRHGYPQGVKEDIFGERFRYGEEAGTGLGLYIVKKTVERYGGNVAVEDNRPQGTVFVLHLRRAHP
ncbi:MAG: ATP-binding protein [Thermoplasmatota archaeon]